MRIESAKAQGNQLILTCSVLQDAWHFARLFEAGDYAIEKQNPEERKRSLDANAFAWVIIDKIAKTVDLPPVEVYRNAVMDMGGISKMLCVETKDIEWVRQRFIGKHLGRQVEEFPSKIKGCTNLKLTKGSSDFTKSEMSVFIENLLQDCESLNIKVDDARMRSLLEEWDAPE